MSKPEPLLWLSDARGIYIPRDFAASFKDRSKSVSGVSAEDWSILDAGPDHEHYWEAWDDVLRDACVTDDDGIRFHVYQEGDLWLIPDGMEYDDDSGQFIWP